MIVAVGGGSPMDCAKGIGIVSANGRPVLDFAGVDNVPLPGPPLICVPTTAGTSADVSQFAIIRDPVKKKKVAIVSKTVVPDVALIDPLTTVTMDRQLTACTGMDALTHAIEAYTNRWPHAETPFHSISAVRMIFANLPRACANGDDLEAREAMLLASFYAGLAFTKAYVGYVHAFSHKVGGMYGVPHGLGNAILLPYVLDFLKDAPLAEQRLAELAVAIGAGTAAESKAVLAQRFVERVRELNRAVGIPERLEALKPGDVPEVARAAMIEAHRDYPVPKNMRLAEAEALLQRCVA
jgi:alcohol dehydrogenase class IV